MAPVLVLALIVGLAGCTSSDSSSDGAGDAETSSTVATTLSAGAASRSILPTVDGDQAFLDAAPGWPAAAQLDPNDPGAFVAAFDQGQVDVGNGSEDGSWVHDDLLATAVALQREDQRVILLATDTYMHFAPDADAIIERVHQAVPEGWRKAPVLVSATHDHHGPDTAFSVNKDWYDHLADQAAAAAAAAVEDLQPAQAKVASGTHHYGVADARDPIIVDPRLNVLTLDSAEGGDRIATVVQWASHPETTLGWNPAMDPAALADACRTKGWTGDDCTAEGRYFTADYPGVLRARLHGAEGGEVLYLNGAIGSQIGPGRAPTWVVDEDHPVTADGDPDRGAQPLTTCESDDPYLCPSFAKTESIGTQLALAVQRLEREAEDVDVTELTVAQEPFFTRMTNIGFRVLLADGSLGWTSAQLYTCTGPPSADTCERAPDQKVDDPVITPLADSQVVVGDVVQTRVARLDLGDVGFLYLPAEVPPELVVGLPDDFESDPAAYYREPENHDVGAYEIPGALLSLPEEDVTFTVGLGTDELGYAVPIGDYRLRCLDLALPGGATCADLAARQVIPSPEFVDGPTCAALVDDPAATEARLGTDAEAVAAICRYGQALGRELGEPDGHYEETNAVGWDLVTDLWRATQRLYGS